MTSQLLIAVVGLAGNLVVGGFFTFMGRQHAKERQFLINAALSGDAYEFMARQAATKTQAPAHEDPEPIQYPEGI